MRGDQFTRQWKILLSLLERKSGLTVQDLAEALEVSVRTVYRDLEVLDRAGVPLVQERDGRHVRWRVMNLAFSGLARGYVLQITPHEIASLLDCIEAYEDGEELLLLRSLARKLVAGLPESTPSELRGRLAGRLTTPSV